jgi:hypothetical protein
LPPCEKTNDNQHRHSGVSHYVDESRTQVVISMHMRMIVLVSMAMMVIMIVAQ